VLLASFDILFWPHQQGPQALHHLDKVIHGSLFGALALTSGWLLGPRGAVLAAVAAYAPLSEVVQWQLLPGRSGDWHDVVADLTGTALGWLLLLALRRWAVPGPAGRAGRPGSKRV
jgi:VanZ family protein